MAIRTEAALAGATVIVKASVDPLPLKVSTKNCW
jgi:hypothetical protein